MKKMSKSFVLFAAALVITAGLIACGHGSGGNNAASNTTSPGVLSDTTPPTVTSTSPVDGTIGVAVDAPITATFSENMNASTISAATFTLSGGEAVPGTITYTGTTATFTPSVNLNYSTTYTAAITAGVQDTTGNVMAGDHSWSFTTAPAPNLIYSQTPSAEGGLFQSSRWDPNGSDYDQYVWDNFTLSSPQTITEITWRGGYDPGKFGSGGPVVDFTVSIYASIQAGIQPDVVNPPIVEYRTGGNAGETQAGTFGGATMYDYTFTLPAPFHAAAETKYWIQIEASQHGIPDWGIAAGTGGDGKYFRRTAGNGDYFYQAPPGDAAFSLR